VMSRWVDDSPTTGLILKIGLIFGAILFALSLTMTVFGCYGLLVALGVL